MNDDFANELLQLRDQARRFLADRCPPSVSRRILDTAQRVLGFPGDPCAFSGIPFRRISAGARE